MCLVAAGMLPLSLQAQSLKIRQIQRESNEEVQKELKGTNERCGSSITAEFDYSGAKDADMEKYSVPSFCNEVLGTLYQICDDPMGKESVQQKVKKLVCKVGTRAIELKEGTLTYTIDWEGPNAGQYVHNYLMNNL
jgi:hypothetical protein